MPFVHSQYLRPDPSSGKLLYSWIKGSDSSAPSAVFEESKEYQVDEEAPDPIPLLEVDAEVADFTSCEQQLLPLTTNAQFIITDYPDQEVDSEEEEKQESSAATPLAITMAEPVDVTTTVVVNSANFNEDGMVTATEVTPYDEENVFQDFHLRVAIISVRLPREALVGKEKLILSNPSSKALRIIAMSKTGLLAESPLRVGCVLQSINNKTCSHLTPSEALCAMVAEPTVYLTAVDPTGESSFVHAKVYNTTTDGSSESNRSNVGLTFVQGRPEGLFIEQVHDDGMFAHSVLNEHDQVFAINGVSCQHMFPSEAMALAERSGSQVAILAKQHRETAVVVSFSRNDFASRMAILVFLVVCCASVSLAVFLHH